jgi:hypothetical protein
MRGLDRLQDQEGTCLVKILIPSSVINNMKKQLRICGINEATIFPDLDGLSRSINAKWGIGVGAEATSGKATK